MSVEDNPNCNAERPAISKGDAVIDFHTHTYFSGDSSTTIDEYVDGFNNSDLTNVCVTDHNSISAVELLGIDLLMQLSVDKNCELKKEKS